MSTAISSSITLYTNNNYNKVSEVSSDWGNRIIQLAKDIAGDTNGENTITLKQLYEQYKDSSTVSNTKKYIRSIQFLFVSYRVGERIFTVQYILEYSSFLISTFYYQVKEMIIYKSIGEDFKPIAYIYMNHRAFLNVTNNYAFFNSGSNDNVYRFDSTYLLLYENGYYNYSESNRPIALYNVVFSKSP